jgi:hypothetical protein
MGPPGVNRPGMSGDFISWRMKSWHVPASTRGSCGREQSGRSSSRGEPRTPHARRHPADAPSDDQASAPGPEPRRPTPAHGVRTTAWRAMTGWPPRSPARPACSGSLVPVPVPVPVGTRDLAGCQARERTSSHGGGPSRPGSVEQACRSGGLRATPKWLSTTPCTSANQPLVFQRMTRRLPVSGECTYCLSVRLQQNPWGLGPDGGRCTAPSQRCPSRSGKPCTARHR